MCGFLQGWSYHRVLENALENASSMHGICIQWLLIQESEDFVPKVISLNHHCAVLQCKP